eukprot:CAMPEP_0171120928 /NCGR_PEP_ID=MMETSP0766_2-20121228/101034_1 /TAXON_ID=439317 /ORGANISM="Gambierdiscus australes, Strain CAWD 149" /LENGTH=44 /DNA_ID= /DNA_START= /DNA_END= /DNA_ORIENTATION=
MLDHLPPAHVQRAAAARAQKVRPSEPELTMMIQSATSPGEVLQL